MVYALKLLSNDNHQQQQQQQQEKGLSSSAAFLGALGNGLNSKLGKFKVMSEQMKRRSRAAS